MSLTNSPDASPIWLQNGKSEIVNSEEWKDMTDDLFSAIQQQLAQSHVTYFTDLTEAEKSLFMDRAIKSIQHSDSCSRMMKKVSSTLDRHLSNEVARELLEEDPVETKPELVIEHAREGAASILSRWPVMKGKMHRCLNRKLPESLRYISWKLFLQNTIARKVYCDTLSEDPSAVHSAHERDIFHKCEALLTAVPIFARAFPQARSSSATANAMTKVLSYYHAKLRTTQRLIDVQYLMMIPLLVASSEVKTNDSISSPSSVATLVEEYISVMDSRPSFVRDSWGENISGLSLNDFCKHVGDSLAEKDSSLASHITSMFSPNNQSGGDLSGTDDNSAVNKQVLTGAMKSMLKPLIRSMFVGFLEVSVVMYIWDQFVIGLDVPDFEIFGPMSVLTLLLLKEPLLRATDSKQLEDIVQRQAISLSVESYQFEFQRHYYGSLHSKLNSGEDLDVAPVIEPVSTFGAPAPWVHWTKEALPERNIPQNRRYAREQRAAIRLRQLKDDQENENNQQIQRQRTELSQSDLEKQRLLEDRLHLEQELEEEKRKREELQRTAEEEITQLQYELQRMRRLGVGDARGDRSPRSSITPVPEAPSPARLSEVTYATGFHPPPNSAKQQEAPKSPFSVMDLYLRNISRGVASVAKGRSGEIDVKTREHMVSQERIRRESELEVFGHVMQDYDWSLFTDSDSASYRQQLKDIVHSKTEKQYLLTVNTNA